MHDVNVAQLSPQTLRQWETDGKPFILIDTLPADHYQAIRLPGARQACVFEVTFLDQIAAITSDRQACIVLYGAGENTMDGAVAAEKLQREGYDSLYVLQGGMAGWQAAGFPVEGASVDDPPPPQTLLDLSDGTFRVDTQASTIEWAGNNPHTRHDGSVRLERGDFQVKSGMITGTLVVDMNTIENRSLAGDELQPVLIAHLKSDDFFFTRRFPKAIFTIKSSILKDTPYVTAPNVDIVGELNLRGATAAVAFTATAFRADDGLLIAKARFDIDRTRWGIIYGSTRFFEHLGMHMVFDLVHFEVKIVGHRQS
jgi:polyisoprenoid-binding protein YceI/rhodanese-related sulfurtransferase